MSAPPKNHTDQLTFRAWLVRQIQVLRWSSPAGESVADTAKALGVRKDVLEEAIAARELANQQAGKPRRALGKRALNRSDYALVRVTMPAPVHADWKRYCETLGVKGSAILRSLIHAFLLTGAKPTSLVSEWRYRGAVYKLESSVTRLLTPSAPTRVTRGAQRVLDEWAAHWCVRSAAIVRGLVVDLLEGRTRALKIVAYPELWGDPARYTWPPPAGLPSPRKKKS